MRAASCCAIWRFACSRAHALRLPPPAAWSFWSSRESDDDGLRRRTGRIEIAGRDRRTYRCCAGLRGDEGVEIGDGEHAAGTAFAVAGDDVTQCSRSDMRPECFDGTAQTCRRLCRRQQTIRHRWRFAGIGLDGLPLEKLEIGIVLGPAAARVPRVDRQREPLYALIKSTALRSPVVRRDAGDDPLMSYLAQTQRVTGPDACLGPRGRSRLARTRVEILGILRS